MLCSLWALGISSSKTSCYIRVHIIDTWEYMCPQGGEQVATGANLVIGKGR